MVMLAALAIADILYLETRDRDTELATLRSFGWSSRTITRMVMIEGVGIGILGALTGAAVGLAAAAALTGTLPVAVFPPIAATALAAIVLAALAATAPALLAGRANLTQLLSQE